MLYNYNINFGANSMNSINLGFLEVQHFTNNIEAISCLKKLENTNTSPTVDDIEKLKNILDGVACLKPFLILMIVLFLIVGDHAIQN